MPNDSDREARLARSLKRLDHRLVKRSSGGFAIADLSGKVVSGAGRILALGDASSTMSNRGRTRVFRG